MDDIVKIRRNSYGKFYIPQNQNCHRDKHFRTKQRGSRDYHGQRNEHRVWVLGNEEVSFLNWKTNNITSKTTNIIRRHITQDTVIVYINQQRTFQSYFAK